MAAQNWQLAAGSIVPRSGVSIDDGVPALVAAAIARGQGRFSADGALEFSTGAHTGRSPRDRFIVRDPETEVRVDWGAVNQPIERAAAGRLFDDILEYLDERELWVQHLVAGSDPAHRLRVRLVTELATHALFARTLFIEPERACDTVDETWTPGFTILHAPLMPADPERHGVRSSTAIVIDFERRLVLIAGTQYAGEIKKSIFSVLQYLLPLQGVATMHCSANAGADGDVALFFGLSGTGKTTLSADPNRLMIGDDEHGWTDDGVFNFEGGLYAKAIGLSAEKEPEIYAAANRFGAVLENVTLDPTTGAPDFDDESVTENTRAAFPIEFMPRVAEGGRGGHPRTIVMLTADAFGVLPPVVRLTPEQAAYYFLSGYTAKVAGTERGVTEPEATFSACFGAPFVPLSPIVYADLLMERIRRHQPSLWLVNTGWTGGEFGVGERIDLGATRAIVGAITNGSLREIEARVDPVFGFAVPVRCPGVPDGLLDPRSTWSDGAAFDATANRLARSFRENFAQYADQVAPEVLAAGPRG
ncbi:MAG: phosphoenolpyruvate carboxykinase (ATP) [Thermomicrobiales bacterium]|nr:phosphoenolpyruvate carboxykinase (ATP) [Thermomicrobiales bacterium]